MGLRLLIISTSVVPLGTQGYGGIEIQCLQLVEELVRLGHTVTVAAPHGSLVPSGATLLETVHLPEEQDRDDIANSIISKHWTTEPYHAAHDFSHQHVLKQRDVPIVHIMWDPIIVRYMFKAHDNVLCVSNWQADRFEKAYGQKTYVMPTWLDNHVYKPIDNPTRERFLFVGKLTLDKGPLDAIKMAKTMGVGLDVVGGLLPTDKRDTLEAVRKEADGKQIRLFFNANDAVKLDLLQNAKAVIYPVRHAEAHWRVGCEAWSCGTPVIVRNLGGMSENFPVVEDFDGFISAMKAVERTHYPELVEKAWKLCSLESSVPQLIDIYTQVSNGFRW